MNTHIPEEYGGPGLGFFDGCLIEEELSWGCSGITTSLGANGLASAPVELGASHEVKQEFYGELAEPLNSASFALPGRSAAPELPSRPPRAVKKGEKYVI